MIIDNDYGLYISKLARRQDFECFNHNEMTNIWADRYAYPDSNIIQCIHVSKHFMLPHKYVHLYVPIKNKKNLTSSLSPDDLLKSQLFFLCHDIPQATIFLDHKSQTLALKTERHVKCIFKSWDVFS
jgi:hypothetical protein